MATPGPTQNQDAGPTEPDAMGRQDMRSAGDGGSATDGQIFGDAEPLPPRGDCDDSRPPVVMVHGFLASGDTWAKHLQRFVANGHCPDRYLAFDWNSLDRNLDHAAALDVFVDGVLANLDTDQVDLFGHSAGGGLGYSYLAEGVRAAKVRRYVHVASGPSAGPAGPEGVPVPTLNLWSPADRAVEGMDIPGATNVQLPDTDHYAVATSEGSFQAIYEFLYDRPPMVVGPLEMPRSIIGGRMVTLGENTPEDQGVLEVWELDSETGRRLRGIRRFELGIDARWGPMAVSASAFHEFVGRSADAEARTVRFFREPFGTDQPLTYLRTFPSPGSLAGILIGLIPQESEKVSLVVFNASRAFLVGQDSLTLDGEELLTEQSASAENTSIALFIHDIDSDDQPGGNSPLFDMFPFLAAIDLPIQAQADVSMVLNFNGRILKLPRDGADTGVLIAVFD